jgi:ribosomal protein L11 methyltransferase
MPYRELIFTVHAEIAEPLGDALMELGALSITVEDAAAGGYDENPLYGEPGLSPDVQAWDRSTVTALFNPDVDHSDDAGFIPELLQSLSDAGFTLRPPEEKIVAEQDWVRLTQSQFAPIQIGERIWVVPSWHETPTDPNAICLAVDPGLAFGTGSHPTTHLCLLWLEQQSHLQNKSLLDYGCGSGILAIAAKKLGCNPVVGTDIDPQAMVAARSNAEINAVDITFALPDDVVPMLGAEARYDIVMANILANPLQVLAPALVQRIRPGGQIVLSGVLSRQADEVIATYSQWLTLSIWKESEGWVCLSGTLEDPSRDSLPGVHEVKKNSADVASLLSPSVSNTVVGFARPYTLALIFVLVCVLGLLALHIARDRLLPFAAPRVDHTASALHLETFAALLRVDQLLCESFGCAEGAIRDFSAWKITSSALGMQTAQQASKAPANPSVLEVEIQNRLMMPIALPHLELILTDTDESAVQLILFSPEEWLPASWRESHTQFARSGAPGGESIRALIPLQLPSNAAGYRVRLFYP